MRNLRTLWPALALIGLVLALPLVASGQEPLVLASTPWTAAFARAAGASRVEVLAPADLRDPAIYELTGKDRERLQNATWVIYGGDETFAASLEQSGDQSKRLQIHTENTPENIATETERIAAALETGTAQTRWLAEFQGVANRVKLDINAVFPEGTRVVAHEAQVPFAEWLGFEIVGEVAPGDLSPARLDQLAAKQPTLMLDSYHESLGPLLAEKGGALYVQLLNHPGKNGTITLDDVLRYNRDQLAAHPPQRNEPSPLNRALPIMFGTAAGLLALLVVSFVLLRRKLQG